MSCSVGDGRRRCARLRPHPQPARRPQDVWTPVARELERRGRQVVVPSLLGAATAPPPQWRYCIDAVRSATSTLSNPGRPCRPLRRRTVVAGHHGRCDDGGLVADLRRFRRTSEYRRNTAGVTDLTPTGRTRSRLPQHRAGNVVGLALEPAHPPLEAPVGLVEGLRLAAPISSPGIATLRRCRSCSGVPGSVTSVKSSSPPYSRSATAVTRRWSFDHFG